MEKIFKRNAKRILGGTKDMYVNVHKSLELLHGLQAQKRYLKMRFTIMYDLGGSVKHSDLKNIRNIF
jgi:hypothetical protein